MSTIRRQAAPLRSALLHRLLLCGVAVALTACGGGIKPIDTLSTSPQATLATANASADKGSSTESEDCSSANKQGRATCGQLSQRATWSGIPPGPYGHLYAIASWGSRFAVGVGNTEDSYGQIIVRTSDGGATWTQVTASSGTLLSISATDDKVGWAVGNYGHGELAILKTADAGATWVSQPAPLMGTSLMGVAAADSSTVWAVGAGAGPPIILKSTDGGATWSQQNAGASNIVNAVAAVDRLTAWAVGDTILKTTDGGATWIQQGPAGYGGNALAVAGRNTVWVITGTTLLKTGDGGRTWTTQQPGTTGALIGISAQSERRAWVTASDPVSGTKLIFETADGGNTWQSLSVPVPSGGALDGISAVKGTVWAAGAVSTLGQPPTLGVLKITTGEGS